MIVLEFALLGVGIFLLIKERRRRKKEQELVLGSLLEGVILLDKCLCITYVNSSAASLLKIAPSVLLGRPLHEGGPLLHKGHDLLLRAAGKGKTVTGAFTLEAERKYPIDLVAVPLQKRFLLLLQDTSSKQKILEVGKDFVANASHELKTPITIIRGFAETLQDTPDLPREIVEDILGKIVRNCQRMNALVKNLLILSDLENLPLLALHPCDVFELCEECRRVLLAVHRDADVEIVREGDSVIEVEAGILELAIFNLLDNAAKYSTPPAKIKVSIHREEDHLEVSISDEGLGIPEQDLEHIFERFYTVNKAHSRKLGGAGLGLSLVKKIIEKHGGKLTVSSVFGKGSTFTFSLPCRSKELSR